MEVAMELEDDLFFADLSKQISLLILDDDDDDVPLSAYPSASFRDLSRENYPVRATSALVVEQSCRKGTGVFIPRSPQPRRKHRQSRQNNSINSNSHRQIDHTRTTSHHQVSYSTSLRPKQG